MVPYTQRSYNENPFQKMNDYEISDISRSSNLLMRKRMHENSLVNDSVSGLSQRHMRGIVS